MADEGVGSNMRTGSILLVLMLTACNSVGALPRQYPGALGLTPCRVLWENGYNIDVAKCDKAMAFPKFKLGTLLRSKSYDPGCRAKVVGNQRWGLKNETLYTIKVYCGGKPMHDKWCEADHWLNCPDSPESELERP
jgi:hypothetical protein